MSFEIETLRVQVNEILTNMSLSEIVYPDNYMPIIHPPSTSLKNSTALYLENKNAPMINLTIKLLKAPVDGYSLPLIHNISISSEASILALKQMIHPLTLLTPESQRLVFKGKVLTNNLSDIPSGSTINLFLKPNCHLSLPGSEEAETSNVMTKETNNLPSNTFGISIKTPSPMFMENLHSFLVSQFPNPTDVDLIFRKFQESFKKLQE